MRDDRLFLARLQRGIDHHERRRSVLRAAAVLLVAVAAFAWLRGHETRADAPVALTKTPVALAEDAVAAFLLEAALLRLDGLGDPAAAKPRLQEIVNQYPGTRSAQRAVSLLGDIG